MDMTLTQLATEDVAAIRHVCDNAWTPIMLSANWDGMASLLTEDVVCLPPEQPIVQGKKAVRAWMDSFPPVRVFTCKAEHIEGRGDLAAARGAFEWTIEPTPGNRIPMKGKWISTFRKQSDGRWLVATDTWNTDHPLSA
jgi:uncharacterized protein (TIGR02246 family)